MYDKDLPRLLLSEINRVVNKPLHCPQFRYATVINGSCKMSVLSKMNNPQRGMTNTQLLPASSAESISNLIMRLCFLSARGK